MYLLQFDSEGKQLEQGSYISELKCAADYDKDQALPDYFAEDLERLRQIPHGQPLHTQPQEAFSQSGIPGMRGPNAVRRHSHCLEAFLLVCFVVPVIGLVIITFTMLQVLQRFVQVLWGLHNNLLLTGRSSITLFVVVCCVKSRALVHKIDA